MSFRLFIDKAEFLPTAHAWCLTGRVLEGKVTHDTLAVVTAEVEALPVKIKTVAFVDTAKADEDRMTLTIEEPSYDIALLEGKELVASQ